MSQPAPKQNFLQTMLIMAVLFMGFNLLFNRQQPTDPRSADQIFDAIRKQAQEIKDKAAKESKTISTVVTEYSQNGPPDTLRPSPKLSADQDMQQLLILNELVCDMSSPAVESQYEQAIESIKSYSVEEKKSLKLKAQIVLADTQFKAASQRQEIQRITLPNDTVVRLARFYDAKPEWDQPIAISASPGFPATSVTPKDLTDQINQLSSHLGKDTLVWGFFPGYQIINGLVALTGAVPWLSYGLAAFLLALCVRTAIWPLSQRQMMWSRQMSQLTPLITEIRNEYKDKPQLAQEMNKKVMDKYQEYGLNPAAGCLPAMFQMPLFLLVYQSMLHYRFEFQKGTFLWINPSISHATNGFIARNLGEKDYILIVIYGISMVVTSLLTPISDPANARQQRLIGISMSVLFGIMMFFWPVPSAFVLYWVFTNILATAQSLRAYRLPLPPLAKKNAPNGGVFAGSMVRPSSGVPLNGNGKLDGKKSTGAPRIQKPKKKK